ncbi:GIY-YIG nuclease family protein [Marinomonas sp. IMCC 4694]|uniref:GIY-YIG nuclease family protein n=1 Tax=Marinomonas sp. IMCC 4694 TaxID=2605432 RepID=UPI0011E7398C|nr:GIY-YIG nuclease family protein [Marinomonas sp. IMCC 4694]TYL47670.1 GIY-YIG nuclease family protein [Marinomonas sp. IMCC 4694]
MVVFRITNNISGKHYIGTSFNSGFQRFEQYVEASNEGLDFPLYNDIRENGIDAFTVEELYETSDKQELYELETDYISIYNGESLRGYKIAQTAEKATNLNTGKKALFDANGVSTAEQPKKTRKAAVKKTVELPKKTTEPAPTAKSFFGELIGEERLGTPTITTVTEKKKAPPRTKSKASIQKMLSAAEKTAKKEREETLKSQQQAEAEEMALIMAKIDVTSKSATSAFRRRKS